MKLIEVLRRMESLETNTIDGDTLVFLIYIQFLLQWAPLIIWFHALVSKNNQHHMTQFVKD